MHLTVHQWGAYTGAVAPFFWYFWSLRRTPYSMLWFMVTVMTAVMAFLVGLALPHVTALGDAAATIFGIGCFAWVAALVTEIAANDTTGEISKYRRKHPDLSMSRPKLRPGKAPQWEVRLAQSQNDPDKVVVWVKREDNHRTIGSADPIMDYEEFVALKVKAKDIADTYNREGIG